MQTQYWTPLELRLDLAANSNGIWQHMDWYWRQKDGQSLLQMPALEKKALTLVILQLNTHDFDIHMEWNTLLVRSVPLDPRGVTFFLWHFYLQHSKMVYKI